MTLKLLDGFDLASMGHNSEEMLHTYITCARLAYADRFEYVADPEFAEVLEDSRDYMRRHRNAMRELAKR